MYGVLNGFVMVFNCFLSKSFLMVFYYFQGFVRFVMGFLRDFRGFVMGLNGVFLLFCKGLYCLLMVLLWFLNCF